MNYRQGADCVSGSQPLSGLSEQMNSANLGGTAELPSLSYERDGGFFIYFN
ncbi:hypothetical protein [Sporosarcina cyprini]|uniref:hypothetical protein n=1 Tax=Sporosarcina cyprini TaxID=2910523 RepID=UPI001EE142FC|nr:hypothetical protein [Sporosarcina cyprini]MCG3089607.1 hypothetical protein [Sporosarcina cyprini]